MSFDDVATDSARWVSMMERHFSDSHCHIEATSSGTLTAARASHALVDAHPSPSSSAPQCTCDACAPLTVLCATSEEDWAAVDAILSAEGAFPSSSSSVCPYSGLRQRRHRIVGGFGIHPWWAQTATEASFDRLEELLKRHPSAVVAEIGVDTVRFAPPPTPHPQPSSSPPTADGCSQQQRQQHDRCCVAAEGSSEDTRAAGADAAAEESPSKEAMLKQQLSVMRRQLAIAARYRRPVSMHVVGKGAYGIVSDYFAEVAARNKEVMGAVAVEVAVGLLSVPTPACSDVGSHTEPTSSQQQQYQQQQRWLFSQYTTLPPSIVFHGFTGSLDFFKGILSLFVLSSRDRSTEERARRAMRDAVGDAEGDTHSFSLPRPDFFIGVGARTTMQTKAFPQLFGGALSTPASAASSAAPSARCLSDAPATSPHHSALSQKEINSLKKFPHSCLLLETDAFYEWRRLRLPDASEHNSDGAVDVRLCKEDAASRDEGVRRVLDAMVSAAPRQLSEGASGLAALHGGLMHCHYNLASAFRGVLHH